MVYLPTFTIKINQMLVNIPYMDPMGYTDVTVITPKNAFLDLPFPRGLKGNPPNDFGFFRCASD